MVVPGRGLGLEDVHNFVSLDEDGSGEGVLASSIEHAANVQTPKAAKALAPRRQKSTSGCCGGNQVGMETSDRTRVLAPKNCSNR